MERPLVLLVEDDEDLRTTTRLVLESRGFDVVTAADGEAGWASYRAREVDLAVIDVVLPLLDGLRLTERIRAHGGQTPILLLTARDLPRDQVVGFEAGADDYVVKPFDGDVLEARLRALLRRRGGAAPTREVAHGALPVDVDGMTVQRDGVPVDLSATEFRLLAAFLDNLGIVLSRSQAARPGLGGRALGRRAGGGRDGAAAARQDRRRGDHHRARRGLQDGATVRHSLRTRITVAVVGAALATLLGVGLVIDHLAATSTRERLRTEALTQARRGDPGLGAAGGDPALRVEHRRRRGSRRPGRASLGLGDVLHRRPDVGRATARERADRGPRTVGRARAGRPEGPAPADAGGGWRRRTAHRAARLRRRHRPQPPAPARGGRGRRRGHRPALGRRSRRGRGARRGRRRDGRHPRRPAARRAGLLRRCRPRAPYAGRRARERGRACCRRVSRPTWSGGSWTG
ncbi:response regulator transcription factor [Nocardioides convexus]|uniref:response regulator transcription factor n=1 Tax=Nocardioides convexus TaxID=2712224 RepID=UPI002418644D|nr:response regulator transcription factor [Nocardioides convexus]